MKSSLRPRSWPVALIVLLASASLLFSQDIAWAIVNAKIRADFPAVPRIETAEMADWLNDAKREPPVLLDVRTKAEFELSHLKNARRVQPASSVAALDLEKARQIVTYCSVGYRSGAYAQALRRAGYTRVANLKGSIFQWANEGRAVFRGTRRVAQVHPYNGTWGLLLNKGYRAQAPPDPK